MWRESQGNTPCRTASAESPAAGIWDRDVDPDVRGRDRWHRRRDPAHPEDRPRTPSLRCTRCPGEAVDRPTGWISAHEVMVKDNHWRALEETGASLAEVLREAHARGVSRYHVEVESAAQLKIACEAGATRLLIDNQVPEIVRAWTRVARSLVPAIEIEASGGIDLTNVRALMPRQEWISSRSERSPTARRRRM